MAQDEYIFIVRCGEVALKGMNKPYFERMLLERIKKLLKKFDGVRAYRHEGLIYVRAEKVPGGEAWIYLTVRQGAIQIRGVRVEKKRPRT